jgi:hypothetical protein
MPLLQHLQKRRLHGVPRAIGIAQYAGQKPPQLGCVGLVQGGGIVARKEIGDGRDIESETRPDALEDPVFKKPKSVFPNPKRRRATRFSEPLSANATALADG